MPSQKTLDRFEEEREAQALAAAKSPLVRTFAINDRVKLSGDHIKPHYQEGAICTVQALGERTGLYGIMSDTDPDTDMLYYTQGHYLTHVTNVPSTRPLVRTFATGATRDTDENKLDFEGFLSPLVLEEFAKYMHGKRKMPDGSMRDSDNWQKGIPLDAYMKSMFRHFFAVWKSHRAGTDTAEEDLKALLFNVQGYLHETLKAKQ